MSPSVRRALLVACAALAAGCAGSPAPGLHILAAPQEQPAAVRFPASVGVGPVSLPEYLDRLQLVSRGVSGGLVVSDTQRWAEPLPEGLARVLAGTLSQQLGSGPVATFPWARSRAPDLQVPVDVLRFESGPDGNVHLDARWSVKRADGAVLVAPRASRFEVPSGGDTVARIRAHGEAAALLGREIANALRETAPR